MALANGVLVHGPTSWACAIRTDDGELKVAARRKRLRAELDREPAAPRPGASARCDGDPPAAQARPAGGAPPVPAALRSGGDARHGDGREGRARLALRSGPLRRSSSVVCSRSRRLRSHCAALTSRRTTAPSTSRSAATSRGSARPRSTTAVAPISSARCWSRPRLGNTLAARAPCARAQPARLGSAARRASRPRPRSSAGWCGIPSSASHARSRSRVTSSSTDSPPRSRHAAQIEVAEAALAACLELEQA